MGRLSILGLPVLIFCQIARIIRSYAFIPQDYQEDRSTARVRYIEPASSFRNAVKIIN